MSNAFIKFMTDTQGIISEFMGKPSKDCKISDVLQEMAEQGTSVLLNWGEDTHNWECSWITSSKQYTSHAAWIEGAIAHCIGRFYGK